MVIMLSEALTRLSNDYTKAKDRWFLQTLEKHNLIKSDNMTNWDLHWLQEEMGVKAISDEEKTQIYVEYKLIGVWYNNYTTNLIDGKFLIETKYWN
jgi:hypothetical protein